MFKRYLSWLGTRIVHVSKHNRLPIIIAAAIVFSLLLFRTLLASTNVPLNPDDFPFADILGSPVLRAKLSRSHPEESLNARAEFGPALHLVLSHPSSKPALCRSWLSSLVLNYPPFSLLGVDHSGELVSGGKQTTLGKLQAVQSFLNGEGGTRVKGGDLAVVTEGEGWLQLPPEVLVERWLALKERESRGRRDGMGSVDLAASSGGSVVMGRVADLRTLYDLATEKTREKGLDIPLEAVFKEVFEENQRISASARQQLWARWLNSVRHSSNLLANNHTLPPEASSNATSKSNLSLIFHTTSDLFHSLSDSPLTLKYLEKHTRSNQIFSFLASLLLFISKPQNHELHRSCPPFPTNDTVTDLATSTLLPLSPNLDQLPTNNAWEAIPLAHTSTSAIPAILLPSRSSSNDTTWQSLWFQPHGRALLRAQLRRPQPFLWLPRYHETMLVNHTRDTEDNPLRVVKGSNLELLWDFRGGRGGVWVKMRWLKWRNTCRGFEDEVFGDGKGVWGREEGDTRTWNQWGKQITGEVLEEKKGETKGEGEHSEGVDHNGDDKVGGGLERRSCWRD